MIDSIALEPEGRLLYVAMLEHPDAGVRELVTHTGLDESAVRRQLDVLADLELLDRGESAQPRPPHVGYGQLIAEAEKRLLRDQADLASAQAALASLAAEHLDRHHRDEIIRLTCLDEINDRLTVLSETAEQECVSFNPGRRTTAQIDESKPLNEAALARGVSIRFVYADSVRNDRASAEYGSWLSEHGGAARTIPVVPHLMVVVDRKVALIPSDPTCPQQGALEVHSPGVVAALMAHFEEVWTRARPLGSEDPEDEHGLTGQQQELLRLLGDGHTDESAARRLDVSLRTVRRMMSDLTDRLGARSRFEAGLLAHQRGWLS